MAPLRARVAEALIRRAGWPPTARAIEGVRNLATYALGAGTASLHVEQEAALLRELARRWSARDVTVVDVGAHAGEYAVRRATRSVRAQPCTASSRSPTRSRSSSRPSASVCARAATA